MKINIIDDINAPAILKKLGLGASNEVQRFIAEDVERLCQPYVPMSAGSGVHMVNSTIITDDSIIYPGPYAHYQYVGEVMGGTAPKHYTGDLIKYNDGPIRGRAWEKRMLADREKDLENDIKAFIKGRI